MGVIGDTIVSIPAKAFLALLGLEFVALNLYLGLSIAGILISAVITFITFVSIKLTRMYHMDPNQRMKEKREGGVSGLMC